MDFRQSHRDWIHLSPLPSPTQRPNFLLIIAFPKSKELSHGPILFGLSSLMWSHSFTDESAIMSWVRSRITTQTSEFPKIRFTSLFCYPLVFSNLEPRMWFSRPMIMLFFENTSQGLGGAVTRWSLYRTQAWSTRFDPQHSYKKSAVVAQVCNPREGDRDRGTPGTCWPCIPAKLMSPRPMRDPVSKCMEDDDPWNTTPEVVLLDILLDQPLEELIFKCSYFALKIHKSICSSPGMDISCHGMLV